MKPKHTPGPWKIETYHDSMFKIVREYDPVIGAERRLEADARLIAAAPELLEALECVLDSISEGRDVSGIPEHHLHVHYELVDKLKRSISKARGES